MADEFRLLAWLLQRDLLSYDAEDSAAALERTLAGLVDVVDHEHPGAEVDNLVNAVRVAVVALRNVASLAAL